MLWVASMVESVLSNMSVFLWEIICVFLYNLDLGNGFGTEDVCCWNLIAANASLPLNLLPSSFSSSSSYNLYAKYDQRIDLWYLLLPIPFAYNTWIWRACSILVKRSDLKTLIRQIVLLSSDFIFFCDQQMPWRNSYSLNWITFLCHRLLNGRHC